MGKQTTKKTRRTTMVTADRLRSGWHGPASIRLHLARPQDAETTDALMSTCGEEMRFTSDLRAAIEDGSASSTMLAGIGSQNAYHEAAAQVLGTLPFDQAAPTVCLTLVVTDEQNEVIGVLSATAPGTIVSTAANNGSSPSQAAAGEDVEPPFASSWGTERPPPAGCRKGCRSPRLTRRPDLPAPVRAFSFSP
ncbi:hypothetical protein ACH4E7_39760 [Kitasatospora sp. NPDC018058]|uniref:hypothetical protein n=1 Tax=Kitasatospora sp. NPDC018058 TaxID=3364025 RepID=UPI0037C02C2C